MLNSNGPSIKPGGILKGTSNHGLYELFVLVLRFLSDK